MEKVLELLHLEKSFGDHQVLRDINLSVRKKGETAFGIRTEMKNLNSFKFIKKAIEYEFARQVEEIESGEKILTSR